MNCPYCNKEVHGFTGLQELQKFQKHLKTCRKNPERKTIVNDEGEMVKIKPDPDMMEALQIRAASGQ